MNLYYLKKYVCARINELVTIDVYSKKALEYSSYPYITIKFPSSDDAVRNRVDWIVELDFWHNSNNSAAIVLQADLVAAGFNYYWQSENEGFYTSHKIFYGEIPVPEPNFSRLQQRYLLKVR